MSTTRFRIGTAVFLDRYDGRSGIVSEIVPPGQMPRTVRHAAGWRRPVESYVVTVVAPRSIKVRARGGMRSASIGCVRLWPNPEALRVKEEGTFS